MTQPDRLFKWYYESDNIRFSAVEAGYIVADLRQNEYYYIEGAKSKLIDEIVRRVGDDEGRTVTVAWEDVSKRHKEAAADLLADKLLLVKTGGVRVTPYRLTWAKKNIFMPWPERRKNSIGTWRVIIFLLSFGIATLLNWIDRPSLTVAAVRLTKRISRTKSHVLDSDIAEAYDDFCLLRSYFYTAHDRCFYDSMVVCFFMALLGYEPSWVFGVQLHPFRAHCWVKVDETVLTDQLALIVGYTPLFAV